MIPEKTSNDSDDFVDVGFERGHCHVFVDRKDLPDYVNDIRKERDAFRKCLIRIFNITNHAESRGSNNFDILVRQLEKISNELHLCLYPEDEIVMKQN